ncbi:MAG: hypothetical protein LBR78_01440 [Holosporales bacterium]|jgi:hypothetical protein|nr:hypothetical protein [Holosporales bacterium]
MKQWSVVVAVVAVISGMPAEGSSLMEKNSAVTRILDDGLEIYYRALTGSEPTVANVYAVFAIGTSNSEVPEALSPLDTMEEITNRQDWYIPAERDNTWQQKIRLAEKIVDSRHGDPIRIRRMYWKLLRTGLQETELIGSMKQAFVHAYGPDMCLAIDEIGSMLGKRGRELDDLDRVADLAAASALIVYTLETNKEILREYAEIAERVATVRGAARDAAHAKREKLAAEQQGRIAELDRLMHPK